MLAERYPHIGGSFDFQSPFQLLVAVMLSARCTDRQVNRVAPRLFQVAPTTEEMATMDRGHLETIIHSIGFFRQKAKHLQQTAERIAGEFSGKVPRNFGDLESLPGVGHKTASVVLGQLGVVATFPVDTHVYRLARRWELSLAPSVVAVERDLKNLFPARLWMSMHLRMIAWGRDVCPARGCDGSRCAICRRLRGEGRP
jgi:endonuclease-3